MADTSKSLIVGVNDKLTTEQDAFVRLRAQGYSVKECSKKLKRSPSVLLRWGRLPNVKLHLDTLVVEVDRQRTFTRAESHDLLMEIFHDKKATQSDRLGAVKELNRLHGNIRDVGRRGHLVGGNDDIEDAVVIDKKVSNMSLEDLRDAANG